jgi:hypothetical protein
MSCRKEPNADQNNTWEVLGRVVGKWRRIPGYAAHVNNTYNVGYSQCWRLKIRTLAALAELKLKSGGATKAHAL